jgi:hypothetical protein
VKCRYVASLQYLQDYFIGVVKRIQKNPAGVLAGFNILWIPDRVGNDITFSLSAISWPAFQPFRVLLQTPLL